MHALVSLRGRLAYWEKRIALERTVLRRTQLSKLAWAEVTRLAIRAAAVVYARELPVLYQVLEQEFAASVRQTVPPRKKSSVPLVPAVARKPRRKRTA